MAGFSGRTQTRSGLSRWEVLVIVLIIGTLTAVLVPLLLDQARVAKDDATAGDALDLSGEIRTAYKQRSSVTSVTTRDGWHMIDEMPVLEASPGVEVVQFTGSSASSWCVELRHPRGELAKTQGVRIRAALDEVEYGACAIPAADSGDLSPSPTPNPEYGRDAAHPVGPWEVTVLSTNRDAGAFIGLGNHPEEFPQVLTTLWVTNTSDIVHDLSMLEFSFGNPAGSGHGYNPWDDWCARHQLDYTASPTVMFPGQSRVVPTDAAGLRMWVGHGDPTEPGNDQTEIALPADGVESEPPVFDSFTAVHERELEQAGQAANAFGYVFTVENVTVTPTDQSQSRVAVTVDAQPSSPGALPGGLLEYQVVSHNGTRIARDICTPGEFPPDLDGQPWTYDFCFTVPEDEADDLLLIIADWYDVPDAVTLDARAG